MFKLEEEPKKGSQNQPISEIDESQTSQVSSALDGSNGSGKFNESKESKNEPLNSSTDRVEDKSIRKSEDSLTDRVEDKSIRKPDNGATGKTGDKLTDKKPKRRFRDFLTNGDIDSSKSSSSPLNTPAKSSEEKSQDNTEKDNKSSSDSHDFHLSQELMKFDFYRKLQSNKEQVVKIIGGIIGALFIIAGMLYLLGSPVRVADNVVSGERAVISAFLVLVGVLIIASIFARRILETSFLKNIHSELEVAEDQNSGELKDKKENQKVNSKENSKDKKGKQKGNIEEKDKK
jgi:hypothetical protein